MAVARSAPVLTFFGSPLRVSQPKGGSARPSLDYSRDSKGNVAELILPLVVSASSAVSFALDF